MGEKNNLTAKWRVSGQIAVLPDFCQYGGRQELIIFIKINKCIAKTIWQPCPKRRGKSVWIFRMNDDIVIA